MIILLHGFGSNGDDSATIRTISDHFPDEVILTPSYQYCDPDQTATYLRALVDDILAQHLDEGELIFIGTSLGAFWSRYLANVYHGSKLIMINPSLEAHNNVRKYIGEYTDYYTKRTMVIGEQQCEAFRKYYITLDRPDIPITIIVADDDDVVPPTASDELIGSSRAHIIHTTGGHRLENTLTNHLGDIERAVYTIAM